MKNTKQPNARRQNGISSGALNQMKKVMTVSVVLFGVAAMSSGAHAAEQQATAERPNVVFLLSDDQGWDDYGFMGHEHIQTPNLDKLAEAGLLYERGYVTDPARYYRILAVPSE